jgi:DNA-binding HxlR family transcriptional regulator
MLSQTVRNLERDGLVTRTVRDLRPLSVEYALTARAQSLVPIVIALKAWAEANLHVIEKSNASFDRTVRS